MTPAALRCKPGTACEERSIVTAIDECRRSPLDVTGQRTRVPGRDRRRQPVRGEHRDVRRSCLSRIEVADVARDQHAGSTVRGPCEHVTSPNVGEPQRRCDRIGRSDNGISDEPDVLLQRSGSMRSIGREQIPTRFAHDKRRPDRSELTEPRSAEEEPRHRRLEQHGGIEEHDIHALTPERSHVDVP